MITFQSVIQAVAKEKKNSLFVFLYQNPVMSIISCHPWHGAEFSCQKDTAGMESEMTADRWKKKNRLAATIWLVLVASSGWLNWRPLKNHSQTCCRRFPVLQVKVILSAILQATGHEMNKWHTNEWNAQDGQISLGCSGLQGWQSVSIVIRQGHEETKVQKVYCIANLHQRVIRGPQHCRESSNQHFLRSRKKPLICSL